MDFPMVFTNEVDGLEAVIDESGDGRQPFVVTFRDTDADEIVTVRFCGSVEMASEWCNEFINGVRAVH